MYFLCSYLHKSRIIKRAALFNQPNLFILITFLDPAGVKGYDYLHYMNFQYKMDYVAIWCTI